MEAQEKLSCLEPCVGSKVEEPPELYQNSIRATEMESGEAQLEESQLEESQSLGSNSSGCSKYFSSSVESKVIIKEEPPELYPTSFRATGMDSSDGHREQPHDPVRCSKYFSSPSQSQPFSSQCPSHDNGMLADGSDCSSHSGAMLGEDCETFGAECFSNTNHEERREDMITEDKTNESHGVFSRLCALQNPTTLSVDSDEVTDYVERTEYMTTHDSALGPRSIFLTQGGPQSTSASSQMKTNNSPKSLEKTLEMVKKRKNGMKKIEDKSRRKRKPSKPSKSMDYCNEALEEAVANHQSSTESATSLATNQITSICQKLKPSKPKKSMDYCNEGLEGAVGDHQPSTEATTSLATNQITSICQKIKQSEPQKSMDYYNEALEGAVGNPQSSTEATTSCEADLVAPTENGPSATNKEPYFSPQHMRFHLNQYECLLCWRTYCSRSALNVHIRTHSEVKPFKCAECDKGFTQKHSLIVHMRMHTGERPFVCTECGAAFADKKNLQHHKALHSNLKRCPDEANLPSRVMNTHARIQNGEKPFRCSLCDKGFTQNHSYKAHMRIHTGERPYLCTECGAAFADNKTLQNHKALHSDEKTYKCTVCPKMFRQRAGLACHMKTHTDEKPFGCEHCGQAFKTKSTLKNHQRIHSEEKPYQCPMCPQAFKQRAGLACHSKVHDKGNVYTPVATLSGEPLPMSNVPKVHSEESSMDTPQGETLPMSNVPSSLKGESRHGLLE